jgi:hypothetical protein
MHKEQMFHIPWVSSLRLSGWATAETLEALKEQTLIVKASPTLPVQVTGLGGHIFRLKKKGRAGFLPVAALDKALGTTRTVN